MVIAHRFKSTLLALSLIGVGFLSGNCATRIDASPTITTSPTITIPAPTDQATLLAYLLATIQPGSTTQVQMEEMFGPPCNVIERYDTEGMDAYTHIRTFYVYGVPSFSDLLSEPHDCPINVTYTNVNGKEIVDGGGVFLASLLNVTLGQIIEMYGDPVIVHITSCADPGNCLVILAYPTQGFEVRIAQENAIRPMTIPGGVAIFPEMTLDEYRAQRFELGSEEIEWDDISRRE